MATVPGQQQPPNTQQPGQLATSQPGQLPSSQPGQLPGPPHSSTPGSGQQNDSNSPAQLSWEGDKMFNIYILDYCNKRGFKKTAKELLQEADLPPDSQPPINARQGLLFEWWSVFWVLFTAKNNKSGNEDAMIYIEHQSQQQAMRHARSLEQQRQHPQQHPPLGMQAGPNGIPMASGQQPGQGPPGQQGQLIGQPPMGRMVNGQRMMNGVGPPPGSQPGGMAGANGAGSNPGFQPGNNGINGMPPQGGLSPGQQMPGGPQNPQFPGRPQPPNTRPGPNGQPSQPPFQSPTMAHSPPAGGQGGPGPQPQQPGQGQGQGPMMGPGSGPSPHLGPRPNQPGPGGMLPPPGQQGPPGNQQGNGPAQAPTPNSGGTSYPMMGMGRSPSRAGEGQPGGPGSGPGPGLGPGGMITQPSPSMGNRQIGPQNMAGNPNPMMGGGNPNMMGMGGMGGGIGGGIGGGMPGGMAMGNSPMMGGIGAGMGGMGGPGGPGGMGGGMAGMGGPGGMMQPGNLEAEIAAIPQHLVLKVKQDAGVEGKDTLSIEEKRRVVQTYRMRYTGKSGAGPPPPGPHAMTGMGGPGGPMSGMPLNSANPNPQGGPGNQPGGPQQANQRARVGGKRNSASGEEAEGSQGSSPPNAKRRRPSPMDTQQSPMPGAASYPPQPPQGNQPGMMARPPQQPGMPQNPGFAGMVPQPGGGMTSSPALGGGGLGMPGGMGMGPGGMPVPGQPGQMQYRGQMHTLHNNRNMSQQPGNAGSPAASGPNEPFRKPSQPGIPGGGMMPPPPPSPGMKREGTPNSGVVGNKDGIKAEGSPRGSINAGQTPGTASSTPVLQHVPPPPPSSAQSQGSQHPTPNSQGVGGPGGMPGGGMPGGGGMGGMAPSPSLLGTPLQQNQPPQNQPPQQQSMPDMFSADFMSSVASQLEADFDSQLFRPEGDINFERDFGQWFNHPDDALDMK
ncbi:hypothetical protein V5O48_015763 [Marasmius crinis-equi]|uniref:LisH domain-containing protein n=1 Tax=Marasmius crinis-equi TaxID=585013 RepID=A0ABR3ETN8_9AGAR